MLDLVLFRHGPAEDRADFARVTGLPDGARPLSASGRERTRRVAKGLRVEVGELATIWTSPLVRATETAAILGEAFSTTAQITDRLIPGAAPEALWDELRERARPSGSKVRDRPLVLVGHEPDLSGFATWLLSGSSGSRGSDTPVWMSLRKAGACRIESAGPGHSRLVWLLRASDLRAIGR